MQINAMCVSETIRRQFLVFVVERKGVGGGPGVLSWKHWLEGSWGHHH